MCVCVCVCVCVCNRERGTPHSPRSWFPGVKKGPANREYGKRRGEEGGGDKEIFAGRTEKIQ